MMIELDAAQARALLAHLKRTMSDADADRPDFQALCGAAVRVEMAVTAEERMARDDERRRRQP